MTTLQSISLSERKKKKVQKQIEKSLHSLHNDRNNHRLHLELANSYSLLENFQQAETHYTSAIELLRLVPVTEKTRKQVIMLYGKIISVNPLKSEAYRELGEEYLAIGQKEKAFRFLLSSAKKAFEHKEFELALQCYNQVIEMGKSNPYIIERCTELYLKLDRKEEAIDNYISIGDMYAQEEKYMEALGYYKKASAVDPEVFELFLKAAQMYQAMEWTENAAAELVKAAEYHERHQNYREALEYYQESLGLDPENEKALAGQQRVVESHTIEGPWIEAGVPEEKQEQDILHALDHIEETHEQTFTPAELSEPETSVIDLNEGLLLVEEEHDYTQQEPLNNQIIDLTEELLVEEEHDYTQQEPPNNQIIDLTEELVEEEHDDIQEEPPNNQIIDLTEELVEEEHDLLQQESPDSQELSVSSSQISLKEFLFDPDEEELILQEGIGEQEFTPSETALEHDQTRNSGANQVGESYPENGFEAFQSETLTLTYNVRQVGESDVKANTEIEFMPEGSLNELFSDEDEDQELTSSLLQTVKEHTEGNDDEIKAPSLQSHTEQDMTEVELQQKVMDLEKQLQNTQEEKYFLQEQFATQIGDLKTRGVDIQNQFESVSHEKEELQQRLEGITSTYQTERTSAATFDETRYDAVIAKIQQKKQLLKQHLETLLKQREENGRLLTEELKNLSASKQRLQSNVEYIQRVKARIEEKVNTELCQAKNEVQLLKQSSKELERDLQDQQQVEQELQEQFELLSREKSTLEEQFGETITGLTEENERLGHQLQELTEKKSRSEKTIKKKFHVLHTSYQKLKAEYKKTLNSKEQELSETARSLSEFVDKYVNLEKTLGAIRKERDKLDKMLARESATREKLEEKLVNIETQVDSLEIQGTELINQLGQELDRQFMLEDSISDEFQMSLGELEKLLVLQEKEIQGLEAI